MSTGEFTNTKYQLDTGNGSYIVACRVQPETLSATINSVANAAPTGAVNAPGSARAGKGIREFGIGMRSVTLEWTGAIPDGYSGDPVRIPVLTPTTFASWTIGQTGTYLSSDVRVVGRSSERVR